MIGILLTFLSTLGFAFVAAGIWQAWGQVRPSRVRVRAKDSRSGRDPE